MGPVIKAPPPARPQVTAPSEAPAAPSARSAARPPPATTLVAMNPPEFRTPERAGPATAKGIAPASTANTGQSHALKMNLWHAKDVNTQVSRDLTSANQFNGIGEIARSFSAMPASAMTRATLFTEGLLAKLGMGPDMTSHQPGSNVVSPGRYYKVAHYIAEVARENGFGNCGEKSMAAAVMLADRGLHPVEIFALSKGDHGFCVVGRAPGSDPHDPSTWGPDAVIVDPWTNENYAASDLAREASSPQGTTRMRGLLTAGEMPKFDKLYHIAGEDT